MSIAGVFNMRIYTVVLLVSTVNYGYGYNVNEDFADVIHAPVPNSSFGYSLAAHKHKEVITIWVGAPKLQASSSSKDDSPLGPVAHGGIYKCLTSHAEEEKYNCMLLDTDASKINENVANNHTHDESKELSKLLPHTALESCQFYPDLCDGYKVSLSDGLEWVNCNQSHCFRNNRTEIIVQPRNRIYRKKCFESLKTKGRISGPPDFTIHDGLLLVNTFWLEPGRISGSTELETEEIKTFTGLHHCLRFCYHAHSLDLPLPVKRSLTVWLEYQEHNKTVQLYSYDSDRDIAGKYWNNSAIDLTGLWNDTFKVYFKAVVYKYGIGSVPSACQNIATIALNDISIDNRPCIEDEEETEFIDSEQSLGLNVATKVSKNGGAVTLSACAPLWQHNCGFAREANGVCYEFEDTGTTTTLKKVHNPVQKECIRGKIDVVMLVDQSGSVNECNFEKIKKWLRSIVHGFTIGPTEQDISIVIYSSKPRTETLISLGFENFNNDGNLKKKKIINDLRTFKYQAGGTYTGSAFKVANDMFISEYSRPDARKMIILLTDGSTTPTDKPVLVRQVRRSRQMNITIMAIGVAKYNAMELIQISNGTKNFFPVKKFSELSQIQDKLRSSVSHNTLEGSGGTHSNKTDEDQDLQHCQLGLSTHYSDTSLLMGSPGCFHSVGDVITYSPSFANISLTNSSIQPQLDDFPLQVRLNDLTTDSEYSIPNIYILESTLKDHVNDIYLGYAVSSGYYFGREHGEYIAASAPRFHRNGVVVIYTNGKENAFIKPLLLHGWLFAEYFGSSLCSVDVNNDGYTDLFVGAPLHTSVYPDEGRVYFYLGGKPENVSAEPALVMQGSNAPFSRFGTTITDVGDLTLDGYIDVAVSSPMEDDGVVYIFHGGPDGMHSDYIQRIEPAYAMRGYEGIRLFGQSVYGKIDHDDNGYPDLLIGIPGADLIAIMYSRAVVTLHGTLEVLTPLVDRNSKECLQNTHDAENPCAGLKLCFSYTGVGLPTNISVAYNVTIDDTKRNPRLLFEDNDMAALSHNFTLYNADNTTCKTRNLYLRENIRDFLTSSEVKLSFTMLEAIYNISNDVVHIKESHMTTTNGTIIPHLHPILNRHIDLTKTANLTFVSDCSDTNNCKSDIKISKGYFVDIKRKRLSKLEMNNKRIFRILYAVENSGPMNGYDIRLSVNFSTLLIFNSIENIGNSCFKTRDKAVTTTKGSQTNILNLMHKKSVLLVNSKCEFSLSFIATREFQPWVVDSLTFHAQLSHINDDPQPSNDYLTTESSPIMFKGGFSTSGFLKPQLITLLYNDTTMEIYENKSVLNFNIGFQTKNIGFVTMKDVRTKMHIPTRIKFKNTVIDLFVIKNVSVTTSQGSCFWNKLPESTSTTTAVGNITLQEMSCRENDSLCDDIECSFDNLYMHQTVTFVVNLDVIKEHLLLLLKPLTLTTHARVYIYNQSNIELMVGSSESVEYNIQVSSVPLQFYKFSDKRGFRLPFWVYIVSALFGLLLLFLLILLLKKCKFFESKYAEKKQAAEEERLWAEENAPLDPGRS